MEKSTALLVGFFLVVVFAHDVVAHSGGGLPFSLHAVCAKTRNANLCHHILHHHLSTAGSARLDASWALKMHIHTLRKSTKHVVAVASMKSKALHKDRMVAAALRGCASDDYQGSLDSLHTAEKRLAARDVAGLKIELSAVLSGYSFCDDEFGGFKVSPVAKSNAKLSDIAKLMLDMARLIK